MSKLKALILWLSVPFQKWIQRRGRRETIMTKSMVDKILTLVQAGDILLSYEAQRWTSWFIKGFYDHAVIISSRGTVIEAVGDMFDARGVNIGGVREVPLEEWLYKKDQVAVVRTTLSQNVILQAAANALKYIGRGYDYSFSHDNEKVYCSELAYLCYRTEWPRFLSVIGETEEILPEEYLDLCRVLDYLELVIDTRDSH